MGIMAANAIDDEMVGISYHTIEIVKVQAIPY
jgi:hypothetical protein